VEPELGAVGAQVNVEELPPEPFLALLERLGLPTRVIYRGVDSPLQRMRDPMTATRAIASGAR